MRSVTCRKLNYLLFRSDVVDSELLAHMIFVLTDEAIF